MNAKAEQRRLETSTGWGRAVRGVSRIHPFRADDPPITFASDDRCLIPAGLGRSYGDAALGTTVLDLRDHDHVIAFDRQSGVLTAQAGLSLDALLRITIPAGWFPPVVPGTRFVTLGGCFAADIHGKNHHVAGTFSQHVKSFRYLSSEYDIHEACPAGSTAPVFHAAAGGMGLTGPILDLTLQLVQLESAAVHGRHLPVRGLAAMMARLEEADRAWPYTVAWVDAHAPADQLGRGEVILGRPAPLHEVRRRNRLRNERYDPGSPYPIPLDPPISLVRSPLVRTYNAARFHSLTVREGLEPIAPFFFPLDALGGWNRLYGPRGFRQYQFVVPDDHAEQVIATVLETSRKVGQPPALVVLKRFGSPAPGPLSFPRTGWTLAADYPNQPGLLELLRRFDEVVLDAGGRVYLAKDDRLSADTFRAMYTGYENWLAIKRELDPSGRWSSVLSRRLGIDNDLREER